MESEPVVLINSFEVPAEQDEAFVQGWERVRDFLSTQDGYISSTLHRSTRRPPTFASSTSPSGARSRRSARRPRSQSSGTRPFRFRSTPRCTRSSAGTNNDRRYAAEAPEGRSSGRCRSAARLCVRAAGGAAAGLRSLHGLPAARADRHRDVAGAPPPRDLEGSARARRPSYPAWYRARLINRKVYQPSR
jgi:hypothetical protein